MGISGLNLGRLI